MPASAAMGPNCASIAGSWLVGFHCRELCVKIWIASQPRSTARGIALVIPPATETCAP